MEMTVYPGAQHGFDGTRAYNVPDGEDDSRCVSIEQPNGTWKESYSGITALDGKGVRIEADSQEGACHLSHFGNEWCARPCREGEGNERPGDLCAAPPAAMIS